MGQKNACETRTTKEVQVDEPNNTSALNAPTPGCTAAKASKISKVYVAATNNDNELECQKVTANALCQAAKQAEIGARRAPALYTKDYSVDSNGGRPKDANPKGQKRALTKKEVTKARAANNERENRSSSFHFIGPQGENNQGGTDR